MSEKKQWQLPKLIVLTKDPNVAVLAGCKVSITSPGDVGPGHVGNSCSSGLGRCCPLPDDCILDSKVGYAGCGPEQWCMGHCPCNTWASS